MEEIDESGEFEEVGSVGDQWIGKFNGISKQNSICITYQSKTHPGMLYVYNFYRRSKKNALVGSFRCACCRQAYDYAKANDLPPPRVCCVRGTIDYVNKTVNFHEDPDTQRHGDCRRRNPHEVKALKLRGDAKNQIRESGIPGRECVELIQKKVLQKDKNDHLPLRWMEVVVDYLLSHPQRLHPLLETPMNEFIGYYRRQWRGKLRFINYYDTEGPRTTNACEAFNSSLNFKLPQQKMDFRTCFTAYKDALESSACDFIQSKQGTKLKMREPQYRDAETGYIERKNEIKELYESDPNANPGIEGLMSHSRKQAYCTTEDFPVAPVDPRFVIQETPQQPPPIPQPQQQPVVNQPNVFIHPFFGQQQLAGIPMLRQPRPQVYRPQIYQHQQLYQRPRINLNQSLPYNHQQFMQQYQPNFNNYHF